MTSLVCWIGVDHRKVASIYLASDSRITQEGRVVSDDARKVFACSSRADIFGYCGNAEAPPRALDELTARLSTAELGVDDSNVYLRADRILEQLALALSVRRDGPDYSNTSIIYGTRQGEGYANAEFHAFSFFVSGDRWVRANLNLPIDSDIVAAEGSGAAQVRRYREYWTSAQGRLRTSRAVFSALCNAIDSCTDAASGGAPQLVGIYQRGGATDFGVLFKGERFIGGKRVPLDPGRPWHDDLFQRCDSASMAPLPNAAKHHRPRGL